MGAKAVIIDHEPLMAAQLKKMLQKGKTAIEVKAICYEGEQAMACLAAHQPDIVFLTLEMPRVSGMIIAKQIEAEKGPHPAIVFVTGQRDFSVALHWSRRHAQNASSTIWSSRLRKVKSGGLSKSSVPSIQKKKPLHRKELL